MKLLAATLLAALAMTGAVSPKARGGMPGVRKPKCREPTWTVVGPEFGSSDRILHRRSPELRRKERDPDVRKRKKETRKAALDLLRAHREELRRCLEEVAPGRLIPAAVKLGLVTDESGGFLVVGPEGGKTALDDPSAACVSQLVANLNLDVDEPWPVGLWITSEVYAFDVRIESIEVVKGPLDADRILNALDPVVEQLRTDVPRMLPRGGKELNLAKKSLDKLSFVLFIDKNGRVSIAFPTRFITFDFDFDFFAERLLKLIGKLLADVQLERTSAETTARATLFLRCF